MHSIEFNDYARQYWDEFTVFVENFDSLARIEANNGTINGNFSICEGRFGSGGCFDGNSSYIDYGDDTSLDILSDNSIDFAIEFWAKGPDQTGFILTKMTDSFATGMYVYQRVSSGNQIELTLATDASNWIYWRTGTNAYSNNVWHHFAWVFDQSANQPLFI